MIETSNAPYIAKPIQAHAEVENRFVSSGFIEVRKKHPLPPQTAASE
ncbi:MAG: hypothetical protein GXY83_11800 [Rhodopirellula sp.]|nr:hypothetical protein [Rhodopirellula sp.]